MRGRMSQLRSLRIAPISSREIWTQNLGGDAGFLRYGLNKLGSNRPLPGFPASNREAANTELVGQGLLRKPWRLAVAISFELRDALHGPDVTVVVTTCQAQK